jgi:hypothetical protein
MLGPTWVRGIIGGALAALLALFIPGEWLERLGAAAGLEVPAVRVLVGLAAFVAGWVAGAKLASRRDWEFDKADDFDLPAAQTPPVNELEERMARIEKALTTLPAQTTKAIKACPSADLDRTLRSIQRALRKPHSDPVLVEAIQALRDEGATGVVARLEALEARIGERLAAIDARLASLNLGEPGTVLPLDHLPSRRPNGLAPKRIGRAVADIKRAIDSLH